VTPADVARRRGLIDAANRLATAASPNVKKYEQLAKDMVSAYATGDAEAMHRINEHYGRSSTVEDLRALVWRLIYKVRRAGGAAHAFGIPEARELISRTSGFPNWTTLTEAAAKGVPPPGDAYIFDPQENRIGPRRNLAAKEWDALIGAMRDRRIPALAANGMMTDDLLNQISQLDFVTSLNLSGSRQLTDNGLQCLARMPQLEHLELGDMNLTDRGLDVLRHLSGLRSFRMCWQRGISDAGVSNLRFCEDIQTVDLMGTPTGDGAIQALRGKSNLRHFKTGRLVTDAGLPLLQGFPIFATREDGEFRYDLMGASTQPNSLLIDGPFTNAGLATLAGLDGLFALDLFWHVTNITSNGFTVLAGLPNLHSLGCDGKLSDDDAMRHIAAMSRLRLLRAQGTVATDDGFIALSRSASLEYFWGRECPNLTGRGFLAFSRLPTLRGIGVSCKNVDDEALSVLPSFPALRQLMPMDVSDHGFRHVGRCEHLDDLWCMYCRDTTDAATEHIAGLRLKTYYAGLTHITDRSLELLGPMTSLELIELYETKSVTDAGLTYIAGLPRLREVRLSGLPHVSLEGTKVFPPHVRVNYWQ
jgi:hypothetical protein